MRNPTFTIANRSITEWISSLPVLIILLVTIFLSSGEIIHSQLLKIGEHTWNEYFLLRGAGAITKPDCNPNPDIDQAVQQAVKEKKKQMEADPLSSIFGTNVDKQAVRKSIIGARSICRDKWKRFKEVQSRVTPGVKVYRTVEMGVAAVVTMLGDYKRLLLCLLVLICASTATVARNHISLRPMRTRKDHYVGTLAQLAANSILLMSSIVYLIKEQQSIQEGVQVSHFYLNYFWIAGFLTLTLITLKQLIWPPEGLEEGGGWGKAILTIPLYSFMAITAGTNFIAQGYYHGISVYLGMMMELSTLFLNLALYIWIGMMLKQTRLANLVFDIFRPWNMSPELLCFVVLVVAAIPTAYTGASGIFVIAAGAVIYNELRRAGANRQLAMAATAMSGSMGVVLRPCLLVVIIAALNKSVTTTELFSSGSKMFMISATLFFIISQFFREQPARIAPFKEALPASIRKMIPLIPYAIIIATVVVFFSDVLSRALDEFSAPIILPVFMLAILIFEKLSHRLADIFWLLLTVMILYSYYAIFPSLTGAHVDPQIHAAAQSTLVRDLILTGILVLYPIFRSQALDQPALAEVASHPQDVSPKLEGSLRLATTETTDHIGALLMLMALSVSVGGIIERSGIMNTLPDTFSSVWVAMTLLVMTLVFIGMIMDPYGAVILVNATIAQVAFKNGIAPLHFWMITLVAFELGYLTPPVALNHLLTRHVIGDDEAELARTTEGPFWRRHEKYLMPIAVMLTALLLVAYVPLMSDSVHHWLFQKIATGG